MIALNNPGNLRHYGNTTKRPYQGLAVVQDHPEFWRFTTPLMGIRAMAVVLRTYKLKHGIDTVFQGISRWAPPGDHNPTQQYAEHVAAACGVGIHDKVDFASPLFQNPAINAMIKQENGRNPYPKLLVAQAVDMALGHA